MRIEDFALKRIIFETRYSIASFAFYGKAGPLLDEHVSRFEQLEAGRDFLKASRGRDTFGVMVGVARSAFDAQRGESDMDVESIYQLGTGVIAEALLRFQRPTAARIGFRCVFYRGYDSFEEPMQILRDSFQIFSSGPFSNTPYRVADVGIAAVVYEIDEHHRLTATIGPYTKSELTEKLPIREDPNLPIAALALDFDYHTKGSRNVMDEGLIRGNPTSESMARALRSFVNRGYETIRQAAGQILGPIGQSGG